MTKKTGSQWPRSPWPMGIVLLAAGCASLPAGPNVMALPGTGKGFEEFRADDLRCRNHAFEQIGGKAREQAANHAGISNAAVGTAVGALAGAAIGGQRGAGAGAGAGLIVGSAAGGETAQAAVRGSQRHYDIAYVQCMYAAGHRVPVSGTYTPPTGQAATSPSTSTPPPPPPTGNPPPPPAGTPPPPPPATSR